MQRAETLRRKWFRAGYEAAKSDQAGEGEGGLTLADVAKMSQREILARADEVEAVLARGAGQEAGDAEA